MGSSTKVTLPFFTSLPRERSQLLAALTLAQASDSWVSDQAVQEIASHLRLTVNDIESVVTSYPDLRRKPGGREVVRVCTGACCWTQGSDAILSAIESVLGVEAGSTSSDGTVTLETTPCCFACAVAPVIEVSEALHGRVSLGDASSLVQSIQNSMR